MTYCTCTDDCPTCGLPRPRPIAEPLVPKAELDAALATVHEQERRIAAPEGERAIRGWFEGSGSI